MPVRRLTRGTPPTRSRRAAQRFVPVCLAAAFAFATLAAPTTADPPAPAHVFAPDGAQRAGIRAGLSRRAVGGQVVLEAQLPASPPAAPGQDGLRLLATTDHGEQIASVDRVGSLSASLRIQSPDGAVATRQMPGAVAAEFTADGSFLFVVDTSGALWRLASATADGAIIAPGPFDGPIRLEPNGTLLLRRVSSVEAPFSAQLMRVDPLTGAGTPLGGDGLVYSAHPLSDGSLAVVAHPIGGGTSVRRLGVDGSTTPIADLGPAAIDVDVAADTTIAYEEVGDGIYLLKAGAAKAERLGRGRAPSFSPNGRELLVRRDGAASVLDLDGSVLAEIDSADASWIACGEECGS